MSKLGLVIGREYGSRVKKKSFIVLTILVPVIMGALGAFALWFGMEEEKHLRVLVDDPADLCNGKIFIGQDENPPATFFFTNHVEDDDLDIIGFAHAEKSGLAAYQHILSNFTIVVSPETQGKGVGRGIFVGFLEHIYNERPDVARLEMEVQVDKDRIALFEAAGFNTEAIIKNRFRGLDDKLSDQALMAWINPNFKG